MIPQIETLAELETADKNYPVYCKETSTEYFWSREKEQWVSVQASELNISVYDMNKQIIGQMDALNPTEVKEKLSHCLSKISSSYKTFMLLFKEADYYTIFINDDVFQTKKNTFFYDEKLSESISECLKTVAYDTYAIDLIEDENASVIEIWIKSIATEEIMCGYLFPYDQGMVSFGRME